MNLKKLLMIALFSFGLVNSAFAKVTADTIRKHDQAWDYYFSSKGKEKAFILFKESAEDGYASSQLKLGDMYRDGTGVTKNTQKAVYWYQKAVEQGEGEAAYSLAHIYLKGDGGIKQDSKKAGQYFELACYRGYQNSCDYYNKLTQ